MMMRKCFVLLSILEMVNFLFKPCFMSQSKILIREVTDKHRIIWHLMKEALVPFRAVGRSTIPLL